MRVADRIRNGDRLMVISASRQSGVRWIPNADFVAVGRLHRAPRNLCRNDGVSRRWDRLILRSNKLP